MNRELLKFFAGFFFASIVLHIVVIISGIFPFTTRGIVFDYSLWTATLTASLVLATICSYLGWERRFANKISIAVILFVLLVVFVNGLYFLKKDDFVFANNKLLMASIAESRNFNSDSVQNVKKDQFDNLTYSFSFGSQNNDRGKVIAMDKDGNTYATGSFRGTINLDTNGKVEKTSLGGIGDDSDIYVAKYDKYGRYIWGISLGSVGYDEPISLKLDGSYFYVAGYFGGRADFDPSDKEFILDAGIGRDGFIAKYDSDGRFVWAQKIGNQESIPFENNDIRFEQISAVGTDESGNVYAAGYFNDDLVFTSEDEKELSLVATKYSRNIFLAKYNKDGKLIKAISFAGGLINEPRSIIVNGGEVFLSGVFNSKIALNVDEPKKFLYTNGGQDLFLVKYDTDLNYLWSKKWGGLLDDDFNSMEVARDGTMIFSGSFVGNINFQGRKLNGFGASDAFIVKIDKSGEVVFAKSFGGLGKDGSLYATTDSVNNIYVTGYFSGGVNFDPAKSVPGAFLESYSSGDATDAFVVKYDNNGNFLWVRSLGGDVSLEDEFQSFSGLAIDSLDYPIVIGGFAGNYTSDDINVSAKGGIDSVIIKYSPEGYKNN